MAAFTIALAAATIRLFQVTEAGIVEQAALTRDAVNAARIEFLATHRPRIKIHEIWLDIFSHDTESDFHKIALMLVNAGESDATLVSAEIFMYYQPNNEPFTPGDCGGEVQNFESPITIRPGEKRILDSIVNKGAYEKFEFASIVEDDDRKGGKLFYVGKITYKGSDEIKRISGFCREEDERGGLTVSDHPYYEYSY